MAVSLIKALTDLVTPKPPKVRAGATTQSPTFDPNSNTGILTTPAYQEHLTDVFSSRTASNSQTLMADLFKQDPDVSAAVSAYLTLSSTDMVVFVRDPGTGDIDRDATMSLQALMHALTEPWDYTKGFQLKPSLQALQEEMRYMALLRGGVANELILDKTLTPDRLENVDLATIKWKEKESGVFKPFQLDKKDNKEIQLDIPTFWVSFHRRDPTKIYQYSDFVSSINTISARQLVINELYSIMRLTGYSRMSVKVLEEVVIRNAPAQLKTDPRKLREYMNGRLAEIAQTMANLKSGQPLVHWDSSEPNILNDKNPGAGMDIKPVIEVLNAQNQAALKTMPTVLGRGGNIQAASVEARYAAMSADELNKPVATNLRRAFQFLLNINGIPGIVDVRFLPAELRPNDELEPQRVMRAARLQNDLSLGIITDEQYCIEMYNRPPNDGAPPLSGTGFMNQGPEADVNAISPNSDALGRSVASTGSKSARSNANKKPGGGRVVAGYDAVQLAASMIAKEKEARESAARNSA